jgi:hypothetical protein
MTRIAPVNLDAVRKYHGGCQDGHLMLALCDEVEALRAERDRLRALALDAIEAAPGDNAAWLRLRDALDGAE